MATEPASAIGAGLLLKAGVGLGAGALGAVAMAAVDPPATRKEMFLRALVAGSVSLTFGPVAVLAAERYIPFLAGGGVTTAAPVLFLTGALSWAGMGALRAFAALVRERAAAKAAKTLGIDTHE